MILGFDSEDTPNAVWIWETQQASWEMSVIISLELSLQQNLLLDVVVGQ